METDQRSRWRTTYARRKMLARMSAPDDVDVVDLTGLHRSRYFTIQNGKEMKWRVSPQKMEVSLVIPSWVVR
jgi:hypothetical protein